jgi:hypothetical protein
MTLRIGESQILSFMIRKCADEDGARRVCSPTFKDGPSSVIGIHPRFYESF